MAIGRPPRRVCLPLLGTAAAAAAAAAALLLRLLFVAAVLRTHGFDDVLRFNGDTIE